MFASLGKAEMPGAAEVISCISSVCNLKLVSTIVSKLVQKPRKMSEAY